MDLGRLHSLLAPLATSLEARCLVMTTAGRPVFALQGSAHACNASFETPEFPRCATRDCPFAGRPHVSSIQQDGLTVAHLFWCSGSRRTNRTRLSNGIARSVSALLALEDKVESLTTETLDHFREITLLHELSAALSGVFDPGEAARIVVRIGHDALQARGAFLAMVDGGGTPTPVATLGALPEGLGRLWAERAFWDGLARSETPVILDGRTGPASLGTLPFTSFLGTAVRAGSTRLGYLGFIDRRDGAEFVQSDARIAATLERQAGAAIHAGRLVGELQRVELLRGELQIARRIQETLLPQALPEIDGLELAARCQPASNVGGDYFDLIPLGGGWLGIVIADVSGHGVGAALMLTSFRMALLTELSREFSPARAFHRVNALIHRDLEQAQMFVTAFLGVYEPVTGSLAYANAGHNPPRLRRAADGALVELPSTSEPLGVFDDTSFVEASVALGAGDALLLYTDGLVEARNAAGEPFGEARLDRTLEAADDGAAALLEAAFSAFGRHIGDAEPSDDVTVVVARRTA